MLVFFTVASLFGWILLFVGLSTRRDCRRRDEQEHTRTTGRIVGHVQRTPRTDRSGRFAFRAPVVEFVADGQTHRADYENRMDEQQFPVGAEVEVLYDVSDPSRFHLEADPVFIYSGRAVIRVALLWIAASAALTVALAVLVGGSDLDFRHLWCRIQLFLRSLKRR